MGHTGIEDFQILNCKLVLGLGEEWACNDNRVKPKPVHLGNNRIGSDAKWAYLFKRPVRSKLVELKI